MMFKQVKDILTLLQNLHKEIIMYYDHLESKTDKQLVRQLLDHLRKNKDEFRAVIERYEDQGYPPVLETWVQFTPEKSVEKEVEKFHFDDEMSIEEVTKVAVHFDNWLEDILRHLIEKTNSKEARVVFSSLLEVLEREKLHLSTNNALMKDL